MWAPSVMGDWNSIPPEKMQWEECSITTSNKHNKGLVYKIIGLKSLKL